MEVHAVVNQLHSLASHPEFRATIVRDQGCLPGLLLFLDHADPKVAGMALETLRMLSECEENRSVMLQQTGMLASLDLLLQRPQEDLNQKRLVQQIRDNITGATPAVSAATTAPATTAAISSKNAKADAASVKERVARLNQNKENSNTNAMAFMPGNSFFQGGANRKARVVVLQFVGLDDISRQRLAEDKLLKVPGVISFTFDMAKARATIRARNDIRVDRICHAIASTKVLSAKQVIKNELGEEALLDVLANATSNNSNIEANTQASEAAVAPASSNGPKAVPDYLPEEENLSNTADEKAIARVAGPNDTNSNGGSSWLGAIGNFMSKSLYW
ncbi:armadillo repeat-containing protein 1 [Capsaspora owczarzaki ATCC 30864]|uniref:Armadillo repeat-containing protein 1 n=1 Tax=Capsaspora owczarzaki (strain ATCC 30864) TaxID=595528 RepID=A0A0D2WH75_CAPO3|nr:armadillo repeat-containing protein 1 [Capsaspora owczarzaki ATCC 30864]KJE88915.1 armadillo repeat-containing protein 1 [Capsaspora owczarzaki ATCC 30864]|eukprot:XP_004365359.1 armadillo repeat-containing protein 1 [Capsaspora owczarzaki ATCC 30864]